ncbi:MAG: hypothetical protein AB7D42_03405 [Candidatus Methanomethylophilaceae archaeon]|nr:hypothetical protein [Candidatus Methanomethylophilaceae archaeon]
MARKEINSNAKAKERHAAIAASRRKEELDRKNQLSDNKYRNKVMVKKRREKIRELPKEDRAEAKEELRKFIEDLKAQEAADKEAFLKTVKERKEKERKHD